MVNIMPDVVGLDVTGVYYRYSIGKDPAADALVHVQNENTLGDGYIFRETDDWSGLAGNTITKAVPISNIPLQYWGLRSIEVEGEASISDASVIYTYRVDQCANAQSSPSCEGYVAPVPSITTSEQDAYNALEDDAYQIASK